MTGAAPASHRVLATPTRTTERRTLLTPPSSVLPTAVAPATTLSQPPRSTERFRPKASGGIAHPPALHCPRAGMSCRIRFVLELPDPDDFQLNNHNPPRVCNAKAQQEAYDQACRQKWQALLLVQGQAGGGRRGHLHPGGRVPGQHRPARQQHRRRVDDPPDRTGLPHLLPAAGRIGNRPSGPIPLPPA